MVCTWTLHCQISQPWHKMSWQMDHDVIMFYDRFSMIKSCYHCGQLDNLQFLIMFGMMTGG